MSRAEGGIAPLLRDYRDYAGARLWLALALMLLGAIAEGFGILMLIPLAAIATGTSSRFSFVLGWLPEQDRFVAALLLFVGFMGARSLLLYWRERELARLQSGYEASLRVRAAATLCERGWAFASTVGQAGMQALLLTDVPRSALAVAQAQQFATALVLLCVQLLIATILSPALGAIALLAVAGGFVVSMRWTRRSIATGLALTARSEASTSSGFRLHAGLKTALAQGTVEPFLAEYASTLRQQQDEAVRFAGDLTSARQLAAFGAAAAAAFVIFIGFSVLHLAFAVLVPVLVLFARMVGPAQVLQHAAQTVGAYSSAFAAICRTLGGLLARPSPEVPHSPLNWNELRLEQATFRHPSGRGIEHIDVVLRRGQWLGLGGPSGTGKTTLVDLVSGLLQPQSGRVLVDEASVEGETLDRWRAAIAYVGQDGLVFDDSVRGNLLADGADADGESLWHALDSVGLADRVRAFPAKLDEQLGDRGSRLSGGERQRLVIARAILRRPSLLILDEATAALDAESEAALLDRLRAIEPRPAAMIIAHRESTLGHCDSVLSIRHR
jgi:ATP-binding cassette subfamily C protein